MRNKLRVIWWVLRGRGVVYRAHIEGAVIFNPGRSLIVTECVFNGTPALTVFRETATGPYED